MLKPKAVLVWLGLCHAVTAIAADDGVIQRQLLLPPVVAPVTDRYSDPNPWVAIIIDDMGNQPDDRLVIDLPGPVACSFLPHTPHAVELAHLAARAGKEVLLHQPMQSRGGNKLGPGALLLEMDRPTFRDVLSNNLAALPHVSGINNHMGSLLTSRDRPMDWLMTELQRYPSMFFIDSRTSAQSVAYTTASDHHIPSSSRDIFLDNDPDEEMILARFKEMIALAKTQGSAIAIGHPYAETLEFLARHLTDLKKEGIDLRPVSEVIRLRKPVLRTAWQQSNQLPTGAVNTIP